MDRSEDEMGSDNEDYMDDAPEAYDLFNDEADEAEEAEKELLGDSEKDKTDKSKDEKVEEEKKPKPKRVVKNPRVVLNYNTLQGRNGLSALKKLFANFQYKGKNHEEEDLHRILLILRRWMCYKLNPKYDFGSTILMLEKLGGKKMIQTLMKKYRLGLDDWGESNLGDEVQENKDEENTSNEPMIVDDFEKEFQLEIAKGHSDIEFSPGKDENSQQTEPIIPPQSQTEVVLTQEQLDRIARNKKLAEERRLKRLSTQQQTANDVEETQTLQEISVPL